MQRVTENNKYRRRAINEEEVFVNCLQEEECCERRLLIYCENDDVTNLWVNTKKRLNWMWYKNRSKQLWWSGLAHCVLSHFTFILFCVLLLLLISSPRPIACMLIQLNFHICTLPFSAISLHHNCSLPFRNHSFILFSWIALDTSNANTTSLIMMVQEKIVKKYTYI